MNLPNKITILRFCLVPVFVLFALFSYIPASVSRESYEMIIESGVRLFFLNNGKWIALAIFCFACATDWLDGFIARKFNLVSNFGKLMDPLADKLLVCSALICLSVLGRLNTVVTLVIVAREFVVSGLRQLAAEKGVVIHASKWGKVKTTLQMLLIIVLLIDQSQLFGAGLALSVAALAATVISLTDYINKNMAVLKG